MGGVEQQNLIHFNSSPFPLFVYAIISGDLTKIHDLTLFLHSLFMCKKPRKSDEDNTCDILFINLIEVTYNSSVLGWGRMIDIVFSKMVGLFQNGATLYVV